MPSSRFRPSEDPAPRGGWFEPDNTAGRRKAVRMSKAIGIAAGLVVAIGGAAAALASLPATPGEIHPGFLALAALPAGALAYLVVHSLALMATGLNWRDLSHDLRIRSVWAILLELALFLSAAAMMLFSLVDAVKHQSVYSACVFVLLACLTWWPLIRHRIRHKNWPN